MLPRLQRSRTHFRALSDILECIICTVGHDYVGSHVWLIRNGRGTHASVGDALRLAAERKMPIIVAEFYGAHWHARLPSDDSGRLLCRRVPPRAMAEHYTAGALADARRQWQEADRLGWQNTTAGLSWVRKDAPRDASRDDDAGGADDYAFSREDTRMHEEDLG